MPSHRYWPGDWKSHEFFDTVTSRDVAGVPGTSAIRTNPRWLILSAGLNVNGTVILKAMRWLPKPFVDGRTCPEAGQLTVMIESPGAQKFWPPPPLCCAPTFTVVLADGAEPAVLAATTEYVVVCDGATLTLHAVPPM